MGKGYFFLPRIHMVLSPSPWVISVGSLDPQSLGLGPHLSIVDSSPGTRGKTLNILADMSFKELKKIGHYLSGLENTP